MKFINARTADSASALQHAFQRSLAALPAEKGA
jgi:hypothetical protein